MAAQPVRLYVYDLSRGMARTMSQAITGTQIDGIWHTSVVVYGREVFYGQGIMEAAPGTTHHGTPVQIIDVGETYIDQDTFEEYLASVAEVYTPQAYHLMDHNCNTFTADVVGFLTGATIPDWITGLPAQFLKTPLGQALRPHPADFKIDAMFRGSNSSEHRIAAQQGMPNATSVATPTTSTPAAGTPPSGAAAANGQQDPHNLASMFLSAVAQQAAGNGGNIPGLQNGGPSSSSAPKAPQVPAGPALQLVTSSSTFDQLLKTSKALVANFTNTAGCPPCRMIKPAYESIAEAQYPEFGPRGARFVEIELDRGDGQNLASRYGVRATPTFMFFKDGKKVDEMAGADKRGLENKIEAFLDDCFPQHAHKRLYLPATERIRTNPITATATPNFTALFGKLGGFAGAAGKQHVDVLKSQVGPFLEGKGGDAASIVDRWTTASGELLQLLKPAEVFPIVDLWRLGLLNDGVVRVLTPRIGGPSDPIAPILALTAKELKQGVAATPRPLLLTTLRLETNLLAPLPLATAALARPDDLLSVLVEALLHPDVGVRKAAADVAVNAAAWRHRVREATPQTPDTPEIGGEDWETELLSALIEAIAREQDADTGHRLLVAAALVMYLNPGWDEGVQPLLEVLGARDTIDKAARRWANKDIRKLADEITLKMLKE